MSARLQPKVSPLSTGSCCMLALVFAFLYLPIVVLILYSFNATASAAFLRAISPSIGTATLRRWRHLGFRAQQPHRRRWRCGSFAYLGLPRPRSLWIAPTSPAKRSSAVSSFFRSFFPASSPDFLSSCSSISRHATQPAHVVPRPRHRAHFRGHHRNFRRPAKNGSRPGRSLARSRRHSLADVLAHHASESQALSHRRRPA